MSEEFIGKDKVDTLHELHSRATGTPSQAGKAEALSSHSMRDASDAMLSWGNGSLVASQGRNDTTKFPNASAGASAEERVRATEPKTLRFGDIPEGGRLGACGVDEIVNGTRSRS